MEEDNKEGQDLSNNPSMDETNNAATNQSTDLEFSSRLDLSDLEHSVQQISKDLG